MAAARMFVDKSPDKWTIALLVGTPVVLGVGYWYYRRTYNKSAVIRSDAEESTMKDDSAATAGDRRIDKGSAGEDKLISTADVLYKEAIAHKDEGNKCFKSADYDYAIKCYNKAILICPKEKVSDLATFYQNRAAAHEQLKNHDMVIEDCTMALDLNSKYVKALQRRAKAYEVTKDLQHSMEDLTAACILEQFQNQTTLLSADRVLKELGRQHAKESMLTRKLIMPSKYFIKTYFSSFAEDPITSNLAHEKESDSAEADLRGYAQAKQAFALQKYDDVITACTEEIDSEGPNKTESLVLRGTFRLLLGEHDLALADLNAVISNEEANVKLRVNALIKRASLFMQLEKTKDSLEDFDYAQKLDPNNSDIFHHRGQVNLLMEQINLAMDDFNRAVELNPNFPIAFVQMCYTEYRHAFINRDIFNMQIVMNKFQSAIQQFPTCSECYTLYAQVLTDQQEYEKADEHFQKAIEVEPDNAIVYVHRGMLQLQWNGDVMKAIDLINQAISIDERCEFAYETLGTIEVQQGNLQHAIELFDKAIPLAKTELERAHLFSLRGASVTQAKIAAKMGISLDSVRANLP